MHGAARGDREDEPTWFVRRVFVSYADHHHDDRVAFWCAAPPGAQEALVDRKLVALLDRMLLD